MFSGALEPLIATARMVSATGLACAAAIGAAPRMIIPTAATDATAWKLAEETDWRSDAGRTRSRQLTRAPAAAGSASGTAAWVRARYPATASSAKGIMLLGSVPIPPKKPKSSMSTQSARHSTVKKTSAGRTSRGCPVTNAAPVTASAATANRLTANPCAAVKVPNAVTQADRT